jgi:hypothetical protein
MSRVAKFCSNGPDKAAAPTLRSTAPLRAIVLSPSVSPEPPLACKLVARFTLCAYQCGRAEWRCAFGTEFRPCDVLHAASGASMRESRSALHAELRSIGIFSSAFRAALFAPTKQSLRRERLRLAAPARRPTSRPSNGPAGAICPIYGADGNCGDFCGDSQSISVSLGSGCRIVSLPKPLHFALPSDIHAY